MSATPGNDNLTGSAAAETIDGLEGDDSIAGLGGADLLIGGDGADTIRAGAGFGTIEGGTGADVLIAGPGAWLIFGGDGDDTIVGADGDDTIVGGEDNDLLIGNAGADSIMGDGGADSIDGSAGNDVIYAGGGNDTAAGGPGSDFIAGEDGDDWLAGHWIVAPAAPTAIALSAATVAENAAGALVGLLSATDPDPWDAFRFSVDDTRFEVVGDALRLRADASLDHEAEPTVTVNVTVRDGNGLGFVQAFVIAVTDVNDAPTGLALSAAPIAENSALGSVVGTLSATDQDPGDVLTYTLLDNAGGAFSLSGTTLVVAGPLDFEAGATRTVTVRVADQDGLFQDRDIVVALANVGGVTINGTAGNDTVSAATSAPGQPRPTAEEDSISGLDGDDLLLGLGGNDTLAGGLGNDRLDGGAGADSMAGGVGNDFYTVDDAGDIVVELAGEGLDRVIALRDWTLGNNVEWLALGGIANLAGTGNALDNLLDGNGGANSLAGEAGNDSLAGGSGADTLAGGLGNDRLDGGAGADSMAGGVGNDTYTLDDAGDVFVELAGEGIDRVIALFDWTLGDNVEWLALGGTANLAGTGNALDNLLDGNGGANRLAGESGNDQLAGGAGADTLAGGLGHDRLDGGTGADSMAGGVGNDIYTVDEAGDVVVELASEGFDRAIALRDWTLGDNVEWLSLGGTANLAGTGNALDNLLDGNAGANLLVGGAGNDTLTGGAGADTMTGDAGADRFVFAAATQSGPGAADLVTDFQAGLDRLDLAAIDSNAVLAGNNAFLFGGQNAAVLSFTITWSETGGTTVVQGDTDGVAGAELRIVLSGTGLGLTAGDFIL